MRGDVTRLEAEVENYRSQIEEFSKKDNVSRSPSSGAALTATAALSAQLADARNAISRKDSEVSIYKILHQLICDAIFVSFWSL